MPETKTEYKSTYPVEVRYLHGITKMIDMPRMSSEVFFDVISEIDTTTGIFEIKIAHQIIRKMVPGLLDKMTVKSGITLVKKIMEVEKDNFDLGELLEPVPTEPDGTSENPESSPASSSTT